MLTAKYLKAYSLARAEMLSCNKQFTCATHMLVIKRDSYGSIEVAAVSHETKEVDMYVSLKKNAYKDKNRKFKASEVSQFAYFFKGSRTDRLEFLGTP